MKGKPEYSQVFKLVLYKSEKKEGDNGEGRKLNIYKIIKLAKSFGFNSRGLHSLYV